MAASPSVTASMPGFEGWPGRRLGLPQTGPRSVARFGRRLAALAVDWLPVYVVSYAFFGGNPWATLALFALLQLLFISLVNGSIGHLMFGMRVVPVTGGRIGVLRPLARTVLLCIVIPAVIWDSDLRGMHDRLSGTVLVRR